MPGRGASPFLALNLGSPLRVLRSVDRGRPMRSAPEVLLFPAILSLAAFARGASSAQGAGTPVAFRRVALSADPAPGTPPGVVFSEFGGVPGANDDFPPRIDARGDVVFHAILSGPGITGVSLADGNG